MSSAAEKRVIELEKETALLREELRKLKETYPQEEFDKTIDWQNYRFHLEQVVDERTKELVKREERFSRILDEVLDMIILVDRQSIIQYISPAVKKIYDYEPQELEGQSILGYVHPEDLEFVKEKFIGFIQTAQDNRDLIEVRLRHKNQSWRFVEIISNNQFSNPALQSMVVTCRDVTARKKAENEIKEKTEELNRFFNVSLDLLCIADINGLFRKLNRQWEAMLGYPIEELEGRNFLELVHPDDLENTRKVMNELSDQKSVLNFVNRYLCKDGSYRWVEWRSFPHNEIIYAAARDITARVTSEQEIRASRNMLRLVLDMIPARVFWKDRQSHFLGCNILLAKDAGYNSEDELIGKSDYDFSWREQADHYRKDDMEVMESGNAKIGFEETQTRPDGTLFWLRTSKIPLRAENGEVMGVLGTYEDITEQKNALNELEKHRYLLEKAQGIAKIGYWELYIGKGLIYGSPQSIEIYGLSSNTYTADVIEKMILPPYREERNNRMRALIERGEKYDIEFKIKRTSDGRILDIHSTAEYNKAENKIFGVIQDITEQKRTIKALEESEERFRLTAEQTGQLIYDYNIETGQIHWSGAIEAMTGYGSEEFQKTDIKRWEELLHPEDRPQALSLLEKAMREHYNYLAEYRFLQKSGDYIFMEDNGTFLRNEKGEAYRMLGSIRDIEDKKLAEKVSKQNEEYFRLLSLSAFEGIVILHEGKILEVNDQFCHIFGYDSRDEIIGRPPTDFIAPDSVEVVLNTIKNKTTDPYHHNALKKDGSIIKIEVKPKFIQYRGLSVRVSVIRDITKQMENERKLRESEANYRSFFEQAKDGILVADASGVFIDANTSICEMIGYSREELLTMTMSDLFDPDQLKIDPMQYELLKKGMSVIKERRIKTKKESEFIVEMNSHQMLDGRFISFFRDVTERNKIQEKVRQSEYRLKKAQEVSRTGSWELEPKFHIVTVSDQALRLLGISGISEKLHLNEIRSLLDVEYIPLFNQSLQELIDDDNRFDIEVRIYNAIEKRYLFLNMKAERSLIADRDNYLVVGTIQDITEHKEIETKIFGAIIETEEKERQRLAQDLHDEVGPLLSSLNLYLSSFIDKLPKDEKTQYIYAKIKDIVKETVLNVRDLSYALSPNIVINFGLHRAILNIIEKNSELIEFSFNSSIETFRFNSKVEIIYYRILKELVNNTLKYAEAKNITIRIHYQDNLLSLDYKDDGKGMDIESIFSRKQGSGLSNILSRVALVDGICNIDSQPGKGFAIKISAKAELI